MVGGFYAAFGWFNSVVSFIVSFDYQFITYLVVVVVGLWLALIVVGYGLRFLVRLFVGWFVLWVFWMLD